MSRDEFDYEREVCTQLARIADALEWQKPFRWQEMMWDRKDIFQLTDIEKSSVIESYSFIVNLGYGNEETFAYDTKEAAEAARAEFVKLWES